MASYSCALWSKRKPRTLRWAHFGASWKPFEASCNRFWTLAGVSGHIVAAFSAILVRLQARRWVLRAFSKQIGPPLDAKMVAKVVPERHAKVKSFLTLILYDFWSISTRKCMCERQHFVSLLSAIWSMLVCYGLAKNTVNYGSFARLSHVTIISFRTLSCEIALTGAGKFVSYWRKC